jgi:uncharacterized membrane protein
VLGAVTVAGAVLVRYSGLNLYALGPPAGFTLLALGGLLVVVAMASISTWPRAISAAVAIFVLCSAAEIQGLTYGIPFGSYHYTPLWKPEIVLPNGKLFPFMLPIAWFILIFCSYQMAAIRTEGWKRLLLTGKIVSAVDLVLEPALTGPVGFWRWDDPNPYLAAPWTNFIGWFVVGVAGAAILQACKFEADFAKMASRLLKAIVIFTFIIGVTHDEYRVVWAIPVLIFLFAIDPPQLTSGRVFLKRRTSQ